MLTAKKDPATGEAIGTGRRKTSVATVRVKPGSGQITINRRPMENYFTIVTHQTALTDTLDAVGLRDKVDLSITVSGGGMTGQAGACRMGAARALVSYDSECFAKLRGDGFLTRDSRMKERKKYGLRGARRGTQFSKR